MFKFAKTLILITVTFLLFQQFPAFSQTVVINGENIPFELIQGEVYIGNDFISKFPTVNTSYLQYAQSSSGVYLYSLKSLCEQFGLSSAKQSGNTLYVTLNGGKVTWAAPQGLKMWIEYNGYVLKQYTATAYPVVIYLPFNCYSFKSEKLTAYKEVTEDVGVGNQSIVVTNKKVDYYYYWNVYRCISPGEPELIQFDNSNMLKEHQF